MNRTPSTHSTPRQLAALLTETLRHLDGDTDSAAIVVDARTRLERLAWSRFVRQTRAAGRAARQRRRHQVHGHAALIDDRTLQIAPHQEVSHA